MEACVPKSTTLLTTDDCTTHVPHVPLMFNSWCLWPYDKDKAEVDSDDEVGLKENLIVLLLDVSKMQKAGFHWRSKQHRDKKSAQIIVI